jgi:hypothetical protein
MSLKFAPSAVSEPRPPRKTARQLRSEGYAREWVELRKRRDRGGQSGALLKDRALQGQDLVRALELAADSTGDPRFTRALEAVKYYGFDREFQRTAARVQGELFGTEAIFLVQVDFLHRVGKLEQNGSRRKLSVREACEMVAAESGFPGQSFASAVEHLRNLHVAPAPAEPPKG